MSLALSIKATRLFLALSVSLWLAGGCLFGCSNIMGAEVHSAHQSTAPEVSADSCHTAHSHHCCTMAKQRKQTASRVNPPEDRPTAAPVPRGMQDCPLAMNGTAVTAKHNGGDQPDAGRLPVAVLPRVENGSEQTHTISGFSYLPNRGPTYLRCCVFLI